MWRTDERCRVIGSRLEDITEDRQRCGDTPKVEGMIGLQAKAWLMVASLSASRTDADGYDDNGLRP